MPGHADRRHTGVSRWIVALLAFVIALGAATPPVDAVAQPPNPRPEPLPSQQIADPDHPGVLLNREYRRLHRHEVWGPTAGTNVVTFFFVHQGAYYTMTVSSVGNDGRRVDGDGNVVPPTAIFDIRDARGRRVTIRMQEFESDAVRRLTKNASATSKHSEQLAYYMFLELGINPAASIWFHNDLYTCDLPGKHCVRKTAERFPHATQTYGHEYDMGKTNAEREASRKRGQKALEREIKAYYKGLDAGAAAARRLFSSTGGTPAQGPLVSLLTGQEPPPGGVDFTSLQLRYISDSGDSGDRALTYSLPAEPSNEVFQADHTIDAARQASDAFFVWLSLPPDTFWLNLSPDEPDRIIDEQLGRTDVGRVLLEADLEMKKTVARWIHPDRKVGRRYWNRLRQMSNGEICASFRQWIVPEPAVVRDDGTALTIIDAPLDVKLESEYFDAPGAGQAACPRGEREVEEHNDAVFREMILPRVRKAVNEAPEYADLRRVYTSRIAAEWYRERSLAADTVHDHLIDTGDISRWAQKGDWRPRKVFDAYVDSFTNGEFDVTRETTQGNMIYSQTYIYGGVDFSTVPFREMSADAMEREHAGLSDKIERSMTRLVAGDGDQLWLGAATAAPPQSAVIEASDVRRLVHSSGFRIGRWVLAAAVVMVLLVLLRRRGIRV